MAKFTIYAVNPQTKENEILFYDNQNSELINSEGRSLVSQLQVTQHTTAPVTSRDTPLGKTSPRILKISLGLSCNYECEYCSQRFVHRSDETNPNDVAEFVLHLDEWVTSPPDAVEFWGGEPLVYIKTLRPLADAIRSKFPNTRLSVITNGSLLTPEINQWLDEIGFVVSISHDGPGQHVRGPDPLVDPDKRAAILDLYSRLSPSGRISFNSMVHRGNQSRSAIQKFFVELTGDHHVPIGEGAFVDAYDEGGLSLSLPLEEASYFRGLAFHEIRTGQVRSISGVRDRLMSFINSLRTRRPSSSIAQKCGMDSPDALAIDLRGNVLTCQNVSAVSFAPNKESHQIGHVSNLANVKLNTSTHWSKREECPLCPMLQICRGACMFLEGDLWSASCDNSFSDSVPIFAAGIEFLTGLIPVKIEGPHRVSRHELWPTKPQKLKRVIPIKALTTSEDVS
ncbi:COG0535 Predicted Fe-S oxidoreductases [Burkholderiaceae bacterium]